MHRSAIQKLRWIGFCTVSKSSSGLGFKLSLLIYLLRSGIPGSLSKVVNQ